MLDNLSVVGWLFCCCCCSCLLHLLPKQKHQREIYFIDSNCLAVAIYWRCFLLFKRCNCKTVLLGRANALHRSLNKQIAEISLFRHGNRIVGKVKSVMVLVVAVVVVTDEFSLANEIFPSYESIKKP